MAANKLRLKVLLVLILALMLPLASADQTLEKAFQSGKKAIARTQKANGSFTNLVQTSSVIYSTELVLFYEYMGILESKRPVVDGLMRWTWTQQNPDGGIPGYPNGPSNVGISVQTYLAARIAGESEATPRMRSLASFFGPRRDLIGEFMVRPFLMAFGIDRTGRCLPSFVEDVALALDEKLPWFKRVLFPMIHIYTSGHIHTLPPEKTPLAIAETGFCLPGLEHSETAFEHEQFWSWIDSEMNSDGTLFEYTPTSIPALMALSTYEGSGSRKARFDSLLEEGIAKLETFQIHYPNGLIQQSPGDAAIGETSVVMLGMHLSGVSSQDPLMVKARSFLLSHQHAATGAFGMSTNNEKNPDSDDTATAIGTLRMIAEADGTYNLPENAAFRQKLRQGVRWMLKLQNNDGGFATWEKDQLGISKPFSNATGMVMSESVLEHSARAAATLASYRNEDPAFKIAHNRVLNYIRSKQLQDGSYSGTWFIDYVFGTALVISALATAPEGVYETQPFQASLLASLNFIATQQRADGGFSESPDSFDQRRSVQLGYSSPAQTGLIVAALLAFSKSEHYRNWKAVAPIVERAIRMIVTKQKSDGLWHDSTLTGVVFPRLEYAIYPTIQESFPLQAIGMYRQALLDVQKLH